MILLVLIVWRKINDLNAWGQALKRNDMTAEKSMATTTMATTTSTAGKSVTVDGVIAILAANKYPLDVMITSYPRLFF